MSTFQFEFRDTGLAVSASPEFEEAEAARYEASICRCKLAGAKPYRLSIEENRVTGVTCAGCGKPVEPDWIEDLLATTADLPVTITWVRLADDYWTGERGDFYGEIAPRADAT